MSKSNYDQLFFAKSRDYLDIYLEKQCSRSAYTIKGYRDALTVFRRYVLNQGISIKVFKFADCNREFILGYLEYLQTEGYAAATCNQRLAAIKSYLWYVADGDITYQQIALAISHVPFLKEPEKEREILNEECLTALLSAPENSKIGIRDSTIMIVLYDTAIRLSELLNLKISDVNFERTIPYLRIYGKGDKERIVSLSYNTVEHLHQYMRLYHEESNVETDWLFYTTIHGHTHAMSPGNVERLIEKYATKVRGNVRDFPKKVHPHMFRRTRATNLYQSDVELELVSRILGHSSIQTTRIYAKPSIEMIKKAMEKSDSTINAEEPLWPDNEAELARLFGLR
jgi:site-specific recombinase XerD